MNKPKLTDCCQSSKQKKFRATRGTPPQLCTLLFLTPRFGAEMYPNRLELVNQLLCTFILSGPSAVVWVSNQEPGVAEATNPCRPHPLANLISRRNAWHGIVPNQCYGGRDFSTMGYQWRETIEGGTFGRGISVSVIYFGY